MLLASASREDSRILVDWLMIMPEPLVIWTKHQIDWNLVGLDVDSHYEKRAN